MITEDELAALVGYRLPGGRARVEPYVDWLVRDVVGAPQRVPGEETVHPAVAFLLAQGRVRDVARKRGARTGVFDLATVEIELDGPDGARHATVCPTYVFPRREGA